MRLANRTRSPDPTYRDGNLACANASPQASPKIQGPTSWPDPTIARERRLDARARDLHYWLKTAAQLDSWQYLMAEARKVQIQPVAPPQHRRAPSTLMTPQPHFTLRYCFRQQLFARETSSNIISSNVC